MTVEIGYGGKITATKYVLNEISVYAQLASERYKELGYPTLAKQAENVSEAIYNCLFESGHYTKKEG